MNVKVVLGSAIVFAAGSLLTAGTASAQFGSQVNVSNVIEGGNGGVSTARCAQYHRRGIRRCRTKSPE